MEQLNLLNNFVLEHKKPLTKNYNVYTAIKDMLYIQEILNMKNLFIIKYEEENEKPDIKINLKWLYIKYYSYLSNNKKLLTEIKKVVDKIISRYNKYFWIQQKDKKTIIYDLTTEGIINNEL
jgi:hypothetical protein